MDEMRGLPKEVQSMIENGNKKSSPAVKLLKGAVLTVVIALAALAVYASVMYGKYVSVEDGVRVIDLTGLTVSIEQYEALRQAYPGAQIQWTVPVAGGLSPDVIALQVKDMDTMYQVLAALKYLPRLTQIDMGGVYLSAEDAAGIAAAESTYGLDIIWSVVVAGKALPYNTTSLTLSGGGITDLTELYRLPMLAEVTLDGVGVSDLSPLASITTLESITLRNMSVDSIEPLGNMYWLGSFFVKNTNVSYAQLNALQRRLPECIIMMLE